MKNIIILLLSFILLLSGCNPYPTDQTLESYGYRHTDNGKYILEVGTSDIVYTYLDSNSEEPKGIAADVYETSSTGVTLAFDYSRGSWSGYNVMGGAEPSENLGPYDPNDVYAYMQSKNPMAITELKKLAEHVQVSTDSLKVGDKSKIEEMLASTTNNTSP